MAQQSRLPNPARPPLGERMRQAAYERGLDSNQIGRAMGKVGSTIRHWWNGVNVPSALQLYEYSRLVGRPIGWFYGELCPEDGRPALLGRAPRSYPDPEIEKRDLLIRLLDYLGAGISPREAVELLAGDRVEAGPHGRAEIEAAVEVLQQEVGRRTGQSWPNLTRRARRAAVEDLLGWLEEPEPPPAKAAPPASVAAIPTGGAARRHPASAPARSAAPPPVETAAPSGSTPTPPAPSGLAPDRPRRRPPPRAIQ